LSFTPARWVGLTEESAVASVALRQVQVRAVSAIITQSNTKYFVFDSAVECKIFLHSSEKEKS
jgi:hypothetical protein